KREQINYPFLKQINIAFWPEFYRSLKHLLRSHSQKREDLERYQQIEQSQQTFANQCQRFFEQINWESANETLELQLDLMEKILADARDITSMIKQSDTRVKENSEQQPILQQKMQADAEEIYSVCN